MCKFSRLSTALVLLAFGAAVSATQTVTATTYAPVPTPMPASLCPPPDLWCCNNTQPVNGGIIAPLLAILGIVVVPITTLCGAGCTSINYLGIGAGGMCTAQPVCCQYNNFSGVVVIGCIPVTPGISARRSAQYVFLKSFVTMLSCTSTPVSVCVFGICV